jgi:cell division inhibitor SulA
MRERAVALPDVSLTQPTETGVPKYLIEREIPNAAALSAAELQNISQRSCGVLNELGPSIQWVQSFVTEDKITCVYIAPNAELIREHARRGGFPADRILEIATVIDPTTAETNNLATAAA